MKITKQQLIEIIKEEVSNMDEGLKDIIDIFRAPPEPEYPGFSRHYEKTSDKVFLDGYDEVGPGLARQLKLKKIYDDLEDVMKNADLTDEQRKSVHKAAHKILVIAQMIKDKSIILGAR